MSAETILEATSPASWSDPVAIGTFALVVVTFLLVITALVQGGLAFRQLRLSIRPLLADPLPVPNGAPVTEVLQFGAPGRDSFAVKAGELYIGSDDGSTQVSLALRNIGSGVAVIQNVTTEPEVLGSVEYSRKFVPVGEMLRVNISVLHGSPEMQKFADREWAYGGFAVVVTYTDAEGKQQLTSRAVFQQYAVKGPFVETIAVYKEGKSTPFVSGSASH